MQEVSDAPCIFDMGTEVDFSMYLLDIGGGFPGSKDTKLKFEEITSVINPALDKYFPSDSGTRFIAELDRAYDQLSHLQSTALQEKKCVEEANCP